MRFNVLVISIDNARSKTIVAHNLAGNRSVSLQHALSLLENLPVIYQINLSREDADDIVARLGKIGVKASAVPREMGFNDSKENKTRETDAAAGFETVPLQPVATATAPAVASAPADSTSRPNFTYMAGVRPDNKPPVHDKRKNFRVWTIVAAACCIGLTFVCAQVKFKFFLPASTAPDSAYISKQKPGTNGTSRQEAQHPYGNQRPAVTDEQMRQASAYADSAKASTDINSAIAFYKLAISFNKHNMDAWYGLINAYTQAQLPEEAQRAESEMKKIFGEGVFSLAQTVQRYGDLLDMYSTEDGTYRIEYRSRQTGQAELLHETFLLSKAFSVQCNCTALSLFAHTDKNKGVLVYLKADPVPASYTDYIAHATVTCLK